MKRRPAARLVLACLILACGALAARAGSPANNLQVDLDLLVSEINAVKLPVDLFDPSTLNKRRLNVLAQIFRIPRYNGTNLLDVAAGTNFAVNDGIVYVEDPVLWLAKDYWATPAETLAATAGDCEDYVILKAAVLLRLGVPRERIRMHHVRKDSVAHMVLSVADPAGRLFILDNFSILLSQKEQRPDLTIVATWTASGLKTNWGEVGDPPDTTHSPGSFVSIGPRTAKSILPF